MENAELLSTGKSWTWRARGREAILSEAGIFVKLKPSFRAAGVLWRELLSRGLVARLHCATGSSLRVLSLSLLH